MSESINRVEPTTNQTAKRKWNWAGIIGLVFGIANIVVFHLRENIFGSYDKLGNTYASLLIATILFSIIGLFFKPRTIAIAGLMTSIYPFLYIIVMWTIIF